MTASGSPPSPNSRAPETGQSSARANPKQVEQVAEERGERWTIWVCECGITDSADCSKELGCKFFEGDEVEVVPLSRALKAEQERDARPDLSPDEIEGSDRLDHR